MRKSTLGRLILLVALLSPLTVGKIWAQLSELTVGSVYHFANAGYTGKAMAATAQDRVGGIALDKSKKTQQWYVESKNGNGHYVLRNMACGWYLRAKGTSDNWTMTETPYENANIIELGSVGSNNTLKGYGYDSWSYAHIDGSSNVVGWESGNINTQWVISKVEYTAAEISANWELVQSLNPDSKTVLAYEKALANIFSDKACTTLKKNYGSQSQWEADADYQALPDGLKSMVLKVSGGNWAENNYDGGKAGWSSDYAKKYRVQLYEPYSEKEMAADVLCMNAHSNLNNPTGLFVNGYQTLYVMVEGTVDPEAMLYLAHYTGHGKPGGNTDGIQLHEGLNVIPYFSDDNNLYINYNVKTFDNSSGQKGGAAKYRTLSSYPTLKIHIEGGHINGYYNKVGDALYPADNNTTWQYIEERATRTDLTVLGKYVALQFPLRDADAWGEKGLGSYFNEQVNVEDCINAWDNVMMWERLVIGVLDENTIKAEAKKSPYSDKPYVFEYTGNDSDGYGSDYSEYYNVHGLSYGTNSGYMYGGWDHCGYHVNTMAGVIKDLPTNAGVQWGPAHEMGHQHQKPLTVNGLTEVTNNLFANIVLWYFGETTSRYNGTEGALQSVMETFNKEGTDFFSNNIWAQTQMYYKLFLYYHVLGHNPKFYPRLFEMLRQEPMSSGYEQDGATCLLHFYKKCCYAAGEDLTEFFRAHGFFRVMDNRLVGDYSNSVYNMTQDQIDAAINEIKTWALTNGKKENIAVLLINDATGDITSHKGDQLQLFQKDYNADLGSYATFGANTTGNYDYTIDKNTVTMTGEGGVGYILLNSKGEIIGFSDKNSFNLSQEAMQSLINGEASIVSVSADGETTPVTPTVDPTMKLLEALINQAEAITALTDDTQMKVGYYKANHLEGVNAALTTAKDVINTSNIAAAPGAYNLLKEALDELAADAYAKVTMKPGKYTLRNYAYPERYMSIDGNVLNTINTTPSSDKDKWIFEESENAGYYYIKNASTGKYVAGLSQSARVSATATTLPDDDNTIEDGEAVLYKVEDMGEGVWAFTCQDGNNQSFHSAQNDSYYIVGWSTSSASRWYLTAEQMDETAVADANLAEIIAQTEELIGKIAAYNVVDGKLQMQVTDEEKAAYLTCSNLYKGGDADSDTDCADLLDGVASTYIHTDHKAAASTYPHYLQVDFTEKGGPANFKFSYRTRHNGANQVPKHIVVKGSNDLDGEFTQLVEFKHNDANNPLPTTQNTDWASTDNITSGYRYLRFYVTESAQGTNTPYFVMAEFSIFCQTGLLAQYSSCNDAYNAANSALSEAIAVNNGSASVAEKNTASSTLRTAYNNLKAAYKAAENTNLATYQTQLETLITQTETLITECGTVTANGKEEITLSKTDNVTENLLESNAYYTALQNGDYSPNCDKLLDGNTSSFFHTDYANTWNEDHYLRAYVPSGVKYFTFTYATRYGEGIYVGHPKTIVVEGCNEANGSYTEIKTLTASADGLPQGATTSDAQWFTSDTLGIGNTYKYIRFRVTATEGDKEFFYMSEFSIRKVHDAFTVELLPGLSSTSNVTEDILLSTWKEKENAKFSLENATTEAALLKAIEELQYEYNVLSNALNALDKTPLKNAIDETQALVDEFYTNGSELKYPNSLYANDAILGAAKIAINEAQQVYDDGGADASECADAIDALAPHNEALTYALSHVNLPVLVTTDMENPVLYQMVIKRDGTPYLKYDHSDNKVAVKSDIRLGDKDQAWIFLDNDAKDGKVFIAPYAEVAVSTAELNVLTDKQGSSGSWRMGYYSSVYEGLNFTTNANNMKTQNGSMTIASGTAGSCTWTLSAPKGYNIESYSFNFYHYTGTTATNIKLNAGGTEYTSSNEKQTLSVENVNAEKATITHSGNNEAIVIENFTVRLVSNTPSLILASNEVESGPGKVKAVAKDSDGYVQDWSIVPNANNSGWFNITCLNDKAETNYFSNWGGVDYKMGFWNSVDDLGGLFQFNPVDMSSFDNESYNLLYNYFNYDTKIKSSDIVGSSNPGYYPESQANAYNSAYSQAKTFLESTAYGKEAYYAAYTELKLANEDANFAIQMPQEGKYYTLNSVLHTGKKMYASLDKATENQLKFNSGMENKPEAIWYVSSVNNANNSFHLTNLQTGASLTNAVTWGGQYALGEEARMVTIQSVSLDGKIILIPQGGHPLHASNGNIIGWDAYTSDSYSAWTFEEVENMSNVTFPFSVTKYGYAGLHLNYPVEVAEGLEAYVVQEVTGEDGVARLTLLEDGIIPANTGVIVKSQEAKDAGETKNYTLNYYDTDATVDNLLDGRNYTQFVKAEANTDYYLFGVKNEEVGLYKAYEEYNSSGTTSLVEVLEQGGTLNGVYPIPGNTYYLRNKHMAGDVRFAVKNGAIEFNTDAENKNDDAFRWACIQPATSADALNALTSATEIQIRNISNTNIYYFCGNKNVASGDDAESIFIWEPAGDSKFYLKKKNPTAGQGDGYMQQSAPSAFGAQATAQKFQAVYAYPTDAPNETSDAVNLVRFKCVDYDANNGKWINCQATGGTPVYNSGAGGFTMHNVYLVGAETTYAFRNVATNKYFGWQSLSDSPVAWNLYNTQQVIGNQGLQEGCVSMKKVDGKYLVVEYAKEWDQASGDGFYNGQFSSSFYFEKFGNSDSYRNNVTSTSKTNDGGYFKCSANKIYLPYSTAANASKFVFRFDGGTTTDIEEALFGKEEGQEIYDLQGRRIERITAPGLYIVNGQKRYVKAVKF